MRAANGTITEYNVTGAGTGSGQGTESASISDLGAVTGNYIDSSGVNHGFVRESGPATSPPSTFRQRAQAPAKAPYLRASTWRGGLQDNTSTRAA